MLKKIIKYGLVTLAWLLLWQIAAQLVNESLLLPGPISVGARICELCATLDFYKAIATSLARVVAGIFIGVVIGALAGLLTALSSVARAFFSPALAIIKATPVASFIFLIVLWISREVAPIIISAMVVTPIVWSNVEAGIVNADLSLLEMAKAYRMSRWATIRYIYLPNVYPYLFASMRASVGMAWKAGIAAEVLLFPILSIGRMISDANTLLETTDLFAWTVVVILLSVIIEKLMVLLFSAITARELSAMNGGERIDRA